METKFFKKSQMANKIDFFLFQLPSWKKIVLRKKKSYDSTMLRCSKNLDNIFLSVRSVKKPIKTKTRTLADKEPKLHGISINQLKFYMTAPC
jgi:hypothetical protein